MDEAESYAFLTSVFREVFSRDDITLFPDMTAKDLIGWDSLKHVDILMEIERRLGREIEPDDINRLVRVSNLADLIVKLTSDPS